MESHTPEFIGLGISIIFSIIIALLKMEHNNAIERISKLEASVEQHHSKEHNVIAGQIGLLQGKIEECEKKQKGA